MKAKRFDQKFDAGKDITGDLDLTKARRAGVDAPVPHQDVAGRETGATEGDCGSIR